MTNIIVGLVLADVKKKIYNINILMYAVFFLCNMIVCDTVYY